MNKMRAITGENMVKVLKKGGWRVVRIKGSHYIMMKDDNWVTLSVPVHKGKTLPIGTQKGLVRSAGLSPEEFNGLL